MPVHKCGSSALCLHELGGIKEDEAGDFEYVEVDPGGRYGRYKEVLGKGAFKTVYRAFDQEDGIEVAWNQVQDVLLQTPEDLDRLYSEVHLLSTLKHKNIIKLFHSWIDEKSNTVNFITEIFTSGTLRQYRKRHKHIDIKAVKNWSRQILRGLLYLHSHDPPIIHRDLKCDNIFINGNQGEVKIGDLGLAAILQHAHARSVIGTPEFMAPELYEEEYTELVDIYSFGMCLLEMVTSEYPYSECTNAAQIYKKVMLGKKPEALKQIKDPELCQFIEKCLAPASKRLPARELLMDPFLQPEGSRGSLETSSHLGRMIRMANDMDVKVVKEDESHGVSATVQISYVLKETLPAYVHDYTDGCACSVLDSKSSQTSDLKANQNIDSIYLSHHKEERARSVDFRVNGKLREDDNVFLKLQISGSEGQVRNIHFPFDVESDTAMCVASEMVAELDLTDQDVTKIAEMIDAAILALIPEWKPGVAIDDCEGFENEGEDDVGLCESMVHMPSDGPTEENASYAAREETVSPSRLEGVIYGRFEEVTYHCHRPEVLAQEAEKCSAVSDTTDTDWSMTDSTSSHESQISLPMNREVVEECSNVIDTREANDSHGSITFSEYVDSKRKSGCTNFVHKIWERVVVHPCDLGNDGIVAVFGGPSVQPECCQQNIESQGISSKITVLASDSDGGVDCDEAAQELAELDLRYNQEMLQLQQKHEAARSEIRNRWRQKKQYYLKSNCEWDNQNNVLGNPENGFHSLRVDDPSCGSQRTLPCDYGSFNSSMASFDELSSFGQETPRSPCRSAGFQEPPKDTKGLMSPAETVYFPLVVGGNNCSSETQDTQEYLVNAAT